MMTADARRILFAWLLSFWAGLLSAQPPEAPPATYVSVDIDLATYINDESIIHDDFGLDLFLSGTDGDVVGYHRTASSGEELRIYDVATEQSLLETRAGSIVSLSEGELEEVLSPADLGAALGVEFDAVSRFDEISLLFSYDVSGNASGLSVDDEDLVLLSGGLTSLFFDGSVEGIDPALDLDGVHYGPYEEIDYLFLSFDGSGTVAGVAFDDEDVLAFRPDNGTWSLWRDHSADSPLWQPIDVDAVLIDFTDPSAIFADGFESGSTSAWSSTGG